MDGLHCFHSLFRRMKSFHPLLPSSVHVLQFRFVVLVPTRWIATSFYYPVGTKPKVSVKVRRLRIFLEPR